jgi:hypothetical protein
MDTLPREEKLLKELGFFEPGEYLSPWTYVEYTNPDATNFTERTEYLLDQVKGHWVLDIWLNSAHEKRTFHATLAEAIAEIEAYRNRMRGIVYRTGYY